MLKKYFKQFMRHNAAVMSIYLIFAVLTNISTSFKLHFDSKGMKSINASPMVKTLPITISHSQIYIIILGYVLDTIIY